MSARRRHAEVILTAYLDHVHPARVTDDELWRATALTWNQYMDGKVFLRDTLAAEEGMAYVANSGFSSSGDPGWCLTVDEDVRKEYILRRAQTARKQMARVRESTVMPMESIDPVGTRRLLRDMARVDEELQDLVERMTQ